MAKLLIGLTLLAVVLASSSRHVFFTRDAVPKDFVKGGFAPHDARVSFMIALKQKNLNVLEDLFWAVSDPQSPEYQNYMTIDEINDLVAPDVHDHNKVISWLRANGVFQIKSYRDSLEVTTTVEKASKLFETTFFNFRNKHTGKQYVRAWGPQSIPSQYEYIIAAVVGLSSFPVPKYQPKVYSPNDNQGVVPQTVFSMYQVPIQHAGDAPNTSVGVIEFESQFFAPSDLDAFAQNVNIKINDPTANHIIGPNDPTSPQIESTLDIQMVAGVNDGATAWFWIEGDPNTWLYGWTTHYFSTKDVPQVASISYGWSEADQCDIDPNVCQQLGVSGSGYASIVNPLFQKIALRGLTLLVASGDSGANGRTDPDCTLPYLKPDYPAACPYVTSVGATQVNNPVYNLQSPPPVCSGQGYSCPSGGQEVAVSYDVASFASGGGFSNVAAMPSYQTSAVKAYLSSGVQLPPASYYNATSRGYPDVAALGNAVLIYQGGIQPVGGTSASAPIWAGVVSILNQYSLKKNGKTLGFLNPFLYQMAVQCPTCFHDITVGDNICTEDGCSSGCQGFRATTGWDPVTGLGSPNVQNIINYINSH